MLGLSPDRIAGRLAAPVPAHRLALVRTLVAAYAAVYLAIRLPVFLDATDQPAALFDPVGVLSVLSAPPPVAAGWAVVIAALVLSVVAVTGRWWRVVGPAWAISLLLAATLRSSWGQVLHHEHLLVLHAAVLAVAPGVPLRRRRSPSPDTTVAAWPITLCALLTVTTYVLAAVAKLRLGGAAWFDGEAIGDHLVYNVLRLELLGADPPWLALELAERSALLVVAGTAVVVVELAAPLALLRLRPALIWAALVWLMHAGIGITMFVVFPYPLAFVALVPVLVVAHEREERYGVSEGV